MSQKITPTPLTLSLHRFSSITPQPLDWLWPLYLPKGKLSLLIGGPATGKTSLALDLAARLSTHSPMPPHPTSPSPLPPIPSTPPSATLLLSPEDNAADTLRPRLDSLGANNDLIHLLPDLHSLTSDAHLEALTQVIAEIPNLALLVIDPLTYYLGPTDRLLKNPDAYTARSVLHSLAQLAARFNIAILLTTRLPKSIDPSAPNFLRRTLATLPYASIARTIHLLTPHTPNPSPQNPPPPSPPPTGAGHKAPSSTQPPLANQDAPPTQLPPFSIYHLSFNISPTSLLIPLKTPARTLPPPLAFSLTDPLTWHPAPITLETLAPPPDPLLQDAADFLRTMLAKGPRQPREIQNHAELNLIAPATLRRAKTYLHIRSFRQGEGPWNWSLPSEHPAAVGSAKS